MAFIFESDSLSDLVAVFRCSLFCYFLGCGIVLDVVYRAARGFLSVVFCIVWRSVLFSVVVLVVVASVAVLSLALSM